MLLFILQVVFLVELPIHRSRKRGHNSVVSGYPTSISFPWVNGWSTNPRVFRRHKLVSEHRYAIT